MPVFEDVVLQAGHERWRTDVDRRMPTLRVELLACDVYGVGPDRTLPPATYGVYLFSSPERHEYVGRTGLTERAQRSGGKSYSGFLNRLKGHVTATHTRGTWAYKRAHKRFTDSGIALPGSRKENCARSDFAAAFREEIETIRAMEFRVVAIESELLSAVFEMYAATVLNTPWNTFHTS